MQNICSIVELLKTSKLDVPTNDLMKMSSPNQLHSNWVLLFLFSVWGEEGLGQILEGGAPYPFYKISDLPLYYGLMVSNNIVIKLLICRSATVTLPSVVLPDHAPSQSDSRSLATPYRPSMPLRPVLAMSMFVLAFDCLPTAENLPPNGKNLWFPFRTIPCLLTALS